MTKETKGIMGMQLFKPLSHHLQGLSLCSDGAVNRIGTPNGGSQKSGVAWVNHLEKWRSRQHSFSCGGI